MAAARAPFVPEGAEVIDLTGSDDKKDDDDRKIVNEFRPRVRDQRSMSPGKYHLAHTA